MKKLFECLENHGRTIISFKRKEKKLLTKEQQESYEKTRIFYICKEKFKDEYAKDKRCCKVKYHCHYAGG